MSTVSLTISPDNSAVFQLTLTNPLASPIYVNDATVTARLETLAGVVVLASFPLPYVTASDGVYRETVIPIVGVVLGDKYNVIIDSTGSDALIGNWVCEVTAVSSCQC